jgi:hypothetical protein
MVHRQLIDDASPNGEGSTRRLACLVALFMVSCGPRTGTQADGDAGATAADGHEDGESATSSGEPDYEPESCEPTLFDECRGPEYDDYWFICDPDFVPPDDAGHPDNGCRNLMCDATHCGECGRKCPFKQCVDGKCAGGASSCVTPEEALEHALDTCAEVCAHFGHECEDRLRSEGEHVSACDRGYGYSLADPWTNEPSCRSAISGSQFQEAHCDEEIRWDHGTEEQPQTGVACCCKGAT